MENMVLYKKPYIKKQHSIDTIKVNINYLDNVDDKHEIYDILSNELHNQIKNGLYGRRKD